MKIRDNRDTIRGKAVDFMKCLDQSVFILGTNLYGISTAKWLIKSGYCFSGFINDFKTICEFGNFQVFKSMDVPGKSAIINCITEGRVVVANENIGKINPNLHIDYFALQLAYPEQLPEINFMEETTSIIQNIKEYQDLYERLNDNDSKLTFENINNFRLNRDISYLNEFRYRLNDQYFEPFIKLGDNPVFIDGGGFDGTTTKTFADIYPNYKKIYYFEPNEPEMISSKEHLRNLQNIYFYQKGLWNKNDNLYFDNSLGNASRLSSDGCLQIQTVTLDKVINTKIDFIKLDIEGAEYQAIIGGKQTIQKHKPQMAVCVYHNQSDFIRIPKLLLDYNPDYKIYLRHYTQGVCETVMYFV